MPSKPNCAGLRKSNHQVNKNAPTTFLHNNSLLVTDLWSKSRLTRSLGLSILSDCQFSTKCFFPGLSYQVIFYLLNRLPDLPIRPNPLSILLSVGPGHSGLVISAPLGGRGRMARSMGNLLYSA